MLEQHLRMQHWLPPGPCNVPSPPWDPVVMITTTALLSHDYEESELQESDKYATCYH